MLRPTEQCAGTSLRALTPHTNYYVLHCNGNRVYYIYTKIIVSLYFAPQARESTFEFLQSETAADCHRDAYALISVLLAEAMLVEAAAAAAGTAPNTGASKSKSKSEAATASAKAALRAIDLAILRGGGQWSSVAKNVILRAATMLKEHKAAGDGHSTTGGSDGSSSSSSSNSNSKRRRVAGDATGGGGASGPESASKSAATATTTAIPKREDIEKASPHYQACLADVSVSAIPRVAAADLTPARFKAEFLALGKPVIITGATDSWPALGGEESAGWGDFDGLAAEIGERLVPVEVYDVADATQTYLVRTRTLQHDPTGL